MARTLSIDVEGQGPVSGLLELPDDAIALYVLAHGAGAGMEHPFMAAAAEVLAERRVGTLRYNFPYMERGGFPPDRPPVATAAVRAAVEAARSAVRISGSERDPLPIFAGGKSFGGRMTSTAAAQEPLPDVRGLIFLGWPLHTAKRPGTKRAAHLPDVTVPMLFIQGDRDKLADLELLRPVLAGLGDRALLHVVEGGDHGFGVLKRSGRTEDEVMAEIGDVVAGWVGEVG